MRICIPLRGKGVQIGLVPFLLAGFTLGTSTAAIAQNLANVPGTTPLQSRTGTTIAAVCGQFIAANAANPAAVVGRDNGTAQGDLFGRCEDMVHNANALLGNGPTAFSLGLTAADLNGALSDIAHDEATVQEPIPPRIPKCRSIT